MTIDERYEAAAVMASDGPWDSQRLWEDPVLPWTKCNGEPPWNWMLFRYRIRPAQPPATPKPCPCCRSMDTRPATPPWTHCNDCRLDWDESCRAPCPECAAKDKTIETLQACRGDVVRAEIAP